MKQIILTIDYELFLGKETGSVKSCMIDPTEKLDNILSINNSKMTVFWDILHFYKLLELEEKYIELKNDRIAIQDQIVNLVKKGHDIQLHLHPHWLDAKFLNGKWVFTYERFKLHTLSNTNDSKDINSILGCVTIAKNLMEQIVREVDKNYKVYIFRAGGYLIEPFDKIKEALYENGIYVDSSVCPELQNESNIFSYNFTNYPKENIYRFDARINEINTNGKFIEIPIASINVPLFRRLYFTLLKKLKYSKIESVKKGSGSGSASNKKKNKLQKIHSFIYNKKYQKLTTDNSFDEKYSYLLSKAKHNSTQILHPKMLNSHCLSVLKSKLSQDEVQFNSIANYVKNEEI